MLSLPLQSLFSDPILAQRNLLSGGRDDRSPISRSMFFFIITVTVVTFGYDCNVPLLL